MPRGSVIIRALQEVSPWAAGATHRIDFPANDVAWVGARPVLAGAFSATNLVASTCAQLNLPQARMSAVIIA